jgi:hypothetical protein
MVANEYFRQLKMMGPRIPSKHAELKIWHDITYTYKNVESVPDQGCHGYKSANMNMSCNVNLRFLEKKLH